MQFYSADISTHSLKAVASSTSVDYDDCSNGGSAFRHRFDIDFRSKSPENVALAATSAPTSSSSAAAVLAGLSMAPANALHYADDDDIDDMEDDDISVQHDRR